MKSLSIIEKAFVGCGRCGKMFEQDVLLVLNKYTDKQLVEDVANGKYLEGKCSECNLLAKFPVTFLFHEPEPENSISLVLSHNNYLRHLYAKNIGEKLLEKYKETFPEETLNININTNLKIIPLEFFLQKVSTNEPFAIIGSFHFIPFPKFNLIESDKNIRHGATNIYLSIIENNYSDDIEKLLSLLQFDLMYAENYLPVKNENKNNIPSGTHGVVEILLKISETAILPILLGVVSNVLYSAIINKGKSTSAKEEEKINAKEKERLKLLENISDIQINVNDSITIRIIDSTSTKEHIFSGKIDLVIQKLDELEKELLLSMYLPGDCHVNTFKGNYFIDAHIDNKAHHVSEFEKIYSKQFSPNTRARISFRGENEEGMKYHDATLLSQSLIKEERYEEALQVLISAYDETDNLIMLRTDYLYNIGLCFKNLGLEKEACNFFKLVLHQVINFPSIQEAGNVITYSSNDFSKKDLGFDSIEENELIDSLISYRNTSKKNRKWMKKYKIKDPNLEKDRVKIRDWIIAIIYKFIVRRKNKKKKLRTTRGHSQ